MGDDHGRSVSHALRLFQGVDYLTKVETVDLQDMPIERLPLVAHRFHRHDLLRKTVLLDPVSVDDAGQIVKIEFRRSHRRLPSFSFIELAVTKEGVYSVVFLVHLTSEGHAYCGRETNSQRTSRKLYTWDPMVWVAL